MPYWRKKPVQLMFEIKDCHQILFVQQILMDNLWYNQIQLKIKSIVCQKWLCRV